MKIQKTDLLQGTLELLVLRLLRSGQLNGWDIMQRIQLVTAEVLSVTPGALYPALHRLEDSAEALRIREPWLICSCS